MSRRLIKSIKSFFKSIFPLKPLRRRRRRARNLDLFTVKKPLPSIYRIIWDYHDFQFKKDDRRNVSKVINIIRSFRFLRGSTEKEFLVIGDSKQISDDILEEFDTQGVVLENIDNRSKMEMDYRICRAITSFNHSYCHTNNMKIIVITSDVDFAKGFRWKRGEGRLDVLVIYNEDS